MGGARPTPHFKPRSSRQKRQVPATPGLRAHTAPGRRRAGRTGSAFRGTAGRAAAGRAERPPCPQRLALSGAPQPALPAGPLPSNDKPRTSQLRGAAGGLCSLARGHLRMLSSPGCGAAAGRGPACGSGGSVGVCASAARAGMSLGPSSLKRSAPHSLTPASLWRRAAAAGALPFLPAVSLTSPAFSPFSASACAPCSPALLGGAHSPRLRPEPSSAPHPLPGAATSVRLA